MSDREHVLESLYFYILENYTGPSNYRMRWKTREYFAFESYSRWAANEFLDYLRNSPIDPYMAAEEFVQMIDNFSCSIYDERGMFSIAYDVSVNLLDFMNALK